MSKLTPSKFKQINMLSKILSQHCAMKGLSFSMQGKELNPELTFWQGGALPLFLTEAKKLHDKIFNKNYTAEELLSVFKKDKPLTEEENEMKIDENSVLKNKSDNSKFNFPLLLEKNEKSIFSIVPILKEEKVGDFFLLSHFALHIVEEYIKPYVNQNIKVIPLDSLFEKFEMSVMAEEIPIVMPNINNKLTGKT